MTHIISKSLVTVTFLFVLYLITACNNDADWEVIDVKCEHRYNPIGIQTITPRFSWKNISSLQGAKQTAYQVLVATEVNKLNEDEADLWNSGEQKSTNQLLVPYEGETLHPGQIMYWKVRTWDQNESLSEWSEIAHFSIGLLEKNDWEASYIGFPSEDGFYQCPQFRRPFTVSNNQKVEKYILHVNSLGYHEIFLNSIKIDNHVLTPAVTQFNKRSLVNSYDVTSYINDGNNEMVIWLGSGWYTAGLPGVTGEGPMVRAQLERVGPNSIETVIVTDEQWTARNSEYKRISDWRSGRYGGETVTGNQEEQQMALTEPDKVSWDKAMITEVPEHLVTPQMVEPNKIQETIHPADIIRVNDSTYIVDMGKNLTGWFEIIFPALHKSQRVEMNYSDLLEENGELAWQGQIDLYIASGSGTEYFRNKFNYHGFRYVKITNIPTAPEISNIKAHLIHTDFEQIAQFECSDPEMNQIHDMIQYTLLCLSLGGYLVDCPQLERLGYGGDGNASTMTAQTMFSLAPLYHNWLDAWEDVIREDGSMPHTAPNPYAAGGGPYWCGFIISAAWQSYQNYGDVSFLEKYYPTMQQWLKYVDMNSEDGLLRRWPDTEYRAWYLGDWATPEGVDQTNEKSVDLVSNCYLSQCYDQMHHIATVLGQKQQAAGYVQKRDELNRKIHETFFVNDIYGTGSQIDMVYPMLVNATPETVKEQVVSNLHKLTDTNLNGHLATGLVGIPVIMEWASRNNQSEWIYSMLKKKSYPGYLYMLENGATTTWEHWNGERSRIHNCYNGVGQWFYQSIGGVLPVAGKPAYREFLINPARIKEINWANTQIETPRGLLSVKWETTGTITKFAIKVPIGSIAKLQKPAHVVEVIINSERVDIADNEVQLQSGTHNIVFKCN